MQNFEELYMGLYENIKKICDIKGISINKLEKELNLPRSSIAKYNTSIPSVEKVRLISEYLHVTIDDILNAEVPKTGQREEYYLDTETAKAAQEVFSDPDKRILFDAARNAKPEAIRFAAQLLSQWKETNPDG